MKIIYIVFSVISLTSCTYNITMSYTQGKAEDLVDTGQKTDADVKPNLTIPVSPL